MCVCVQCFTRGLKHDVAPLLRTPPPPFPSLPFPSRPFPSLPVPSLPFPSRLLAASPSPSPSPALALASPCSHPAAQLPPLPRLRPSARSRKRRSLVCPPARPAPRASLLPIRPPPPSSLATHPAATAPATTTAISFPSRRPTPKHARARAHTHTHLHLRNSGGFWAVSTPPSPPPPLYTI